jgi:hypothetical protein
VNDVGKAGDVGLANLDDGKGKDGKVGGDDAATDGLALALTGAAGAVARVALGEKKADTGRVHDTLLHRETLLVVATGDTDDVALPLVAEGVGGDLSAHLFPQSSLVCENDCCECSFGLDPSPVFAKRQKCQLMASREDAEELTYALVHEDTELSLILNLDELLRAVARVGDVELHVGGWRNELWSSGTVVVLR